MRSGNLKNPAAGPNRRDFVRASVASVASLGCIDAAFGQATNSETRGKGSFIRPGDIVLFQGDSITDTGRSREVDVASQANSQPAMGNGYAWLTASTLLLDRPDDGLKFFNRGISGNKVHQLDERWQTDCVDLKPSVVSILIGVNDIWHTLNGNFDSTVEKYVVGYRALVERTRKELPDARLVICEPFVTRCGAVDDKWFPEFDGYRAAARQVANESGARFVPFQSMFDALSKLASPEHWAHDGVHPTWAGSAMMAHTWLKSVGA